MLYKTLKYPIKRDMPKKCEKKSKYQSIFIKTVKSLE